MNFDKFTVRLHYLHIFFMLTKFQGDQKLIVISSINCLDSMVNYIRFAWKLACMLRPHRTRNPMVVFSKYEFNNKLLVGVTFFRVTSGVT